MSELTDEQLRNCAYGPYHSEIKSMATELIALRAECVKLMGARPLLERAMEELRLIHMKDCSAVYDVTLRAEYSVFQGATEPKKKWADTFSAEDVLLAAYFPDSGAKP